MTRLTYNSLTLYKLCVIGAIALNACVDAELQSPARTNNTRFTYLYLDGFTSLNYIIFIILVYKLVNLLKIMAKIYFVLLIVVLALGHSL